LEKYKFSSKLNHFALRGKLLINAAKAALKELQLIKLQLAEFDSWTRRINKKDDAV
jgi:hypothetical protein